MKLLRFYLQRVCIFSLKHCIRSLVCMTCMIKVFATLFGRHVYLTTHSMLCYLYSSMHEGQRKCGINTVLASTVCPFLVQCSMQEGKNIYKHLYFCVAIPFYHWSLSSFLFSSLSRNWVSAMGKASWRSVKSLPNGVSEIKCILQIIKAMKVQLCHLRRCKGAKHKSYLMGLCCQQQTAIL